jgi:enamine deaminase RidA (YjgF/YER057c/UK114 family)
MADFGKFNEVYLKYFTAESKPARSCVAMREIHPGNPAIKLSIESIASVP